MVNGYEGLKQREARMPARGQVHLAEAAERVVALYKAWGKVEKAEDWKKKLGLADLPDDIFARP